MMKKGKMIIVCLVIIAMMTACGNNTNSQDNNTNSTNSTKTENTDTNKKEEQEETKQTEEADDKLGGDDQQTSDEAQTDTTQDTAQTGVNIKVYCSNADASGFESEEVSIQSLSSDEVLKALVGKGVLPVDVSLLSFKEFEKDGEKALDLDFSKEFYTYIKTLGSSSEYYIVGSVCNTFLDAYGCDKVHMTVDGEVFATGHAEYPGYMGKFN